MITAENITDEQIRELARSQDRETRWVARSALGLPHDAADCFLTWPEIHSREAQRQRRDMQREARVRCAKIWNARNGRKEQP